MTRREIMFLTVVTAFGAALRFFQIGAQSLWLDELFSVLLARRDLAAVVAGTAQDTMPPLYYFLLHFVLQWGSDEIAARMVSFFFSVATIPLFYALARQVFATRAAQVAAFFLVLNPLHIFYAQEARMYAVLSFFVLASYYFFWRAWLNGRTRDWVWFAILQVLAFYTHSLAFLNLFALDLFALVAWQKSRERLRALVLANLAIVILFTPWMLILVQQAVRVRAGFWVGLPSPFVFVTTPYLFLFSSVVPEILVPVALFAALILIAFAVFAAVRAIFQADDSQAILFAMMTLIVPIAMLYILSFVRSIYIERTLLPASFGLYLLLAWAVTRAKPHRVNVALSAAVFVITLVALVNFYFNPDAQKPRMRDAARALAAQIRPGDAIAHTSDSSALAFAYYAPNLSNHFLSGDPDYVSETTRGQTGRVAGLVPEDLNAVVAGHPRLWLVVALDHSEDYQKARVAEMNARFRQANTQTVGGINLILFQLELHNEP